MTFFRTFETSLGDVLVMRQDNDEGGPEIRYYFEPETLGLCSIAVCFDEDDYEIRDSQFDKIDLAQAELAAKEICRFA